jgi:type VII secretion protein EccE
MSLAGNTVQSDPAAPRIGRATPAGTRSARQPLPIRAGQVVAAQVAIALLIAAVDRGALVLTAAVLGAAGLFLIAWCRFRRRWLYEWIGIGLRYLTRPHALTPECDAAALLDRVNPGALVVPIEVDGNTAAMISDGYGLTVIIELGDPGGLLADRSFPLPAPAALLPTAGPDSPPVRIQLLLCGVAAPALRAGGGTPATSYRQLTEGRLLGHERALLAVRVLRTEGWSEHALQRSLSGLVRKIRRRLNPIPARVLGERAALDILPELAHHDGTRPVQESWSTLHAGGLVQSVFRLRRWPAEGSEGARRLVTRLLALPTAATTISIGAGPRPTGHGGTPGLDLVVRLAAHQGTELASAMQAMQRICQADGAVVARADGEQWEGLAATLPLGFPPIGTGPAATAVSGPDLTLGAAGLMLGVNRHGEPVVTRLFRAESTRVMLIGGLAAAQLIALRAMALGARVLVQTTRPRAWEPFIRGVAVPGADVAVVSPGRSVGAQGGTPLHPLLVVVDVGPVAADPQPGPGWQATLVVRDELTPQDGDPLSRADLVILQVLRPAEAALAGTALGLGGSAEWLTRIRPDMIGVINRRALRWAVLSTTPIEAQLIGSPARYATVG